MKITISYASFDDINYLRNDTHIKYEKLEMKINAKEIIVVKDDGLNIGWLRFGFFWDTIPFMNMIRIENNYQKKGIGTKIVKFWEDEMKLQEYKLVMTSTQANEDAQHFYRNLGYHDMGALFELNDGPAEIFFCKKIR